MELRELTHIYTKRGLSPELAEQVAKAMTAHDALGTHLRDELGITDTSRARPLQAALSSAAAFALGALPPIAIAAFVHGQGVAPWMVGVTLVLLGALGALAAWLGGASLAKGAFRVLFWGAAAMGATALIGRLFGGVAVG